MIYWKSSSFKALQKAWYQLLKDAGFQDAEKNIGDEMELKQHAAYPLRHLKSDLDRQSKEEYFNLLSQNIQDTEFVNEVDETVLVLYSDGKKIKEICAYLNEIGEQRCRAAIRFIIRRYEMKWGMKTYTPRQLNRKR